MKIKKILIFLGVIILITIFNLVNATYINPGQLQTRTVTIKSEKIDSSFNGYLIAYFSDLNYKGEEDNKQLDKLIEKINDVHPDVIVFGGDLTYANNVDTSYLKSKLSKLEAKKNKYAILGDEDTDEDIELLSKAGFTILYDENVQLYLDNSAFINLIGVSVEENIAKAFAGINSGFNLTVCHYPDSAANLSLADYILAGHSLGSRVYIPIVSSFNTIDGANKYFHGKQNVNNATLDITNGVGTKEKGKRFLADAEVVVYKLQSY